MYHPRDTCLNTGETVLEVLLSNHPEAHLATDTGYHGGHSDRDRLLDLRRAGPGGSDVVSLHRWLILYGEASAELLQIFASFTEFLANSSPPWEEYHALVAGRLIGLEKHTGIRPVRIGETWRRCFAKCILVVARPEAKEACGTE